MATIGAQIDLAKYPLDAPGSDKWNALVARCRNDLDAKGMFELPGFLTADALRESAATILPRMANESVEIRRTRNYVLNFGFSNYFGLHTKSPKLGLKSF